jgi:hypothetical protein
VRAHPRIHIAFLKSGGGWIAPWLDRTDRHFDDPMAKRSVSGAIAGLSPSIRRSSSGVSISPPIKPSLFSVSTAALRSVFDTAERLSAR